VARNVPVWTWDIKSEAFGNSAPNQNPDLDANQFVFSMRFPGQRYDLISGLNQNGFREYEPGTGRYPQSDPLGQVAGVSTYAYAHSQPIMMIDPLGLQSSTLVGPGATGAAGAYNPNNLNGMAENWGPTTGDVWHGLADLMSNLLDPPPKNITSGQQGVYDQYCKGQDDKCASLKAATQSRILEAKTKMGKMFFDNVLYQYAYATRNPAATGGHNSTWLGHADDLGYRIDRIRTMISLGKLMGCDMSSEEQQARYLFVPKTPLGY
jgi:RHS repeat-associated protein